MQRTLCQRLLPRLSATSLRTCNRFDRSVAPAELGCIGSLLNQNTSLFSSSSQEKGGEKDLREFASKNQVTVDLKTLRDSGLGKHLHMHAASENETLTEEQKVLVQVASFLHREMPVRLARRVVELEEPVFCGSKYVKEVSSWYKQSFRELRQAAAPYNEETEEAFAQTISCIYERHAPTLMTMAKGAQELRMQIGKDEVVERELEIQKHLDKFYMCRIGIRMLIGQYLALRDQYQRGPDDSGSERRMIGMIQQDVSPFTIAQHAIEDAEYMCTRAHGDAPIVTIHGRTDQTFPYVPSHLHYMLLELLKNSMRATVETHGVDDMPPIKVIIADGEENEDVCIKVSDEGGGIRRSHMPSIWSYLFTTADPAILEALMDDTNHADFGTESPLAGLGYGLPISRCYARYFGGDLNIMSMEGYGTDSYIYLNKLGDKTYLSLE